MYFFNLVKNVFTMKKNQKNLIKSSNEKPIQNKCVILTGGGSGGHLFPLQSLTQELKSRGVILIYLGRDHPLEREIMINIDLFHRLPVGKLRRNWSSKVFIQNFTDLFRVVGGLIKGFFIIRRIKKKYNWTVIFSSGGFVAVPVVVSGFLLRLPIIIHEQTSQAGLTNRISGIMANTICTSFPESKLLFNSKKTVYTGFPIREDLYKNLSIKNLSNSKLKKVLQSKKPVILFSGGSNGSKLINEWIRDNLGKLTENYFICHQTGIGFIDEFSQIKDPKYFSLGFISQKDWALILKKTDIVVGRSGAGIVHECIYLKKKAVFIPLAIAQKNEQYYNAVSASKQIDTVIIKEAELSSTNLLNSINSLLKSRKLPNKNSRLKDIPPVNKIVDIILSSNIT